MKNSSKEEEKKEHLLNINRQKETLHYENIEKRRYIAKTNIEQCISPFQQAEENVSWRLGQHMCEGTGSGRLVLDYWTTLHRGDWWSSEGTGEWWQTAGVSQWSREVGRGSGHLTVLCVCACVMRGTCFGRQCLWCGGWLVSLARGHMALRDPAGDWPSREWPWTRCGPSSICSLINRLSVKWTLGSWTCMLFISRVCKDKCSKSCEEDRLL